MLSFYFLNPAMRFYAISLYTSVGIAPFVKHSFVMITSAMFSSEGIRYIMSVIKLSMMVRSPLAPVFKRIAVFAISHMLLLLPQPLTF